MGSRPLRGRRCAPKGLVWLALAPADAALAAHILGPSILTGIGLAASFAVVAAAMVVLARTKNR